MEKEIIIGETHCNTVGHIFKNEVVRDLLGSYYEYKSMGEDVSFIVRGKTSKKFYQFISDIFESENGVADFLKYVRNHYLSNLEEWENLKKTYGNGGILKALLSLHCVHDSLSIDKTSMLSSIFSIKTIEVLRQSQRENFPLSIDACEYYELDYQRQRYEYSCMEDLLKQHVFPINSNGKIIGLIREQVEDEYLVFELGTGENCCVDYSGQVIDDLDSQEGNTIREVIKTFDSIGEVEEEIRKLKQLLVIHNSPEDEVFSSKLDDLYYDEQLLWLNAYHYGKEISDARSKMEFRLYLVTQIRDLEEQKRVMAEDTTQTDAWNAAGITPGICGKLPDEVLGKQRKVARKKPELTVVKS